MHRGVSPGFFAVAHSLKRANEKEEIHILGPFKNYEINVTAAGYKKLQLNKLWINEYMLIIFS